MFSFIFGRKCSYRERTWGGSTAYCDRQPTDDSEYCRQHQCRFEGCNNGQFFHPTRRIMHWNCQKHECRYDNCRQTIDPGHSVCRTHMCSEPDCHERITVYGFPCPKHRCGYPNCVKYHKEFTPLGEHIYSCDEHMCHKPGCYQAVHTERGVNYNHCKDHLSQCLEKDCDELQDHGYFFCAHHRCHFNGCPKMKDGDETTTCLEHTCSIHLCQRMTHPGSKQCEGHNCATPECDNGSAHGKILCPDCFHLCQKIRQMHPYLEHYFEDNTTENHITGRRGVPFVCHCGSQEAFCGNCDRDINLATLTLIRN